MNNALEEYFNDDKDISSSTIKHTVKSKEEINGERYIEFRTIKLTKRKIRISYRFIYGVKNFVSFLIGIFFVIYFAFLPKNIIDIFDILKRIYNNFYDVVYFLSPYSRYTITSWKFIYSLNAGMIMVLLSSILFIICILVENSDGGKISFIKSLLSLSVLFWGLSYINYFISFIFCKIGFFYKILVVILLFVVNFILSVLYYAFFFSVIEDS